MAITKILNIMESEGRNPATHLKNALEYIQNPDKTEECVLVGSINCLPDTAFEQMEETKNIFHKTGKRQGYHVIISFSPEEKVTAEQAMYVLEHFAKDVLGDDYEAVYAVHTDREHMHGHLIWNSVSMTTGKKYNSPKSNWKNHLQPITNKYCDELGLAIIPEEYSRNPKNISRDKWEKEMSMKEIILRDAKMCAYAAGNVEHFKYLMKSLGYIFKKDAWMEVQAPGFRHYHKLAKLDEMFSEDMLRHHVDMPWMAKPYFYSSDIRGLHKAKLSPLYALPNSHRTLITSVIRKLLASSSMAVAETFKVLKGRLETLKETTRTESADESIDFFLSFFDDDEIETDDDSKQDQLYTREKVNEFIQHEIDEVTAIINKAESIKRNAKMTALKQAVEKAFVFQNEAGIKQRIVVFTESIRTQQYMFEELSHAGYEGQILKFNGSTNDPVTKQIYKAWKARNYGKYVGSRNVELKNAIVEAFRDEYKILLVTDSGSEGLNLQFCNTIINYDLPWNPQKIEQRIGRCHRYGQKNDVVVINLLIRVVKNKYNSSEQRYLSFEGKKEITSRIPSWEIAQVLEKLAISYDKNKEKQGCYDVVIATNMIAVGMDVDRLGLMSVVGQPKQNSEYIQATSRVGRQHPGIIFTVYNPYRPRDLSNYENFVGFHSQMYRYVEGTTATPFAARARDRVLHALVSIQILSQLLQYCNK